MDVPSSKLRLLNLKHIQTFCRLISVAWVTYTKCHMHLDILLSKPSTCYFFFNIGNFIIMYLLHKCDVAYKSLYPCRARCSTSFVFIRLLSALYCRNILAYCWTLFIRFSVNLQKSISCVCKLAVGVQYAFGCQADNVFALRSMFDVHTEVLRLNLWANTTTTKIPI